jgi:endonuclease/exonuclease/phosphatase family metal-dependent hydrolase
VEGGGLPLDVERRAGDITFVRLTTWNTSRGANIPTALQHLAWAQCDLVALQECRRPPEAAPDVLWRGTDPIQGIAVISRNLAPRLEQLENPNLHPTILPVLVHGPTPFLLVAVWTQKTPTYEAVALGAVAACTAGAAGVPLIVAGDFNISPAVIGQERTATDFFKRMRDEFGLVSAYHSYFAVEPGHETHPTYFHQRKESAPFHLDYVFLPDSWVHRITGVRVGSYSEWRMSDHRPLIVDLRQMQ